MDGNHEGCFDKTCDCIQYVATTRTKKETCHLTIDVVIEGMSSCKRPRTTESMIDAAAAAHGEIQNAEVRRKRKAVIENDIAHMFSTLPKRAAKGLQTKLQQIKPERNGEGLVGNEAQLPNDTKQKDGGVSIHLFRKALRLHDNEGLAEAVKCSMLIPLYIFHIKEVDPELLGLNRIDVILQSLVCLDESLREKGSRLYVAIGDPVDVVKAIIRRYPVCKVTYERDHNPVQREKNNAVAKMVQEHDGVEAHSYSSYTLFNVDHVLSFLTDGKALLSMTEFLKVIADSGNPEKPINAPSTIPPPPEDVENVISEVLSSVPSLSKFTEEYGYCRAENNVPFLGGEKEALRRLEEILENDGVDHRTSSGLSPYLSQGSLSVRLLYDRLKEILTQRTHTLSESEPAVGLGYQLFRRELAHVFSYLTPEFNHRPNNPLCSCMDIPWLMDDSADVLLKRWEMGQTGYPSVDAVMNQLRNEGWVHHRGRELVLSFLTRGGLFLFWKMGMDLLETYSIDYDWAINGYNWHHLSCTTFYFHNFNVHDPVTFFQNDDPNGEYIRKYVPVLQSFPKEYIFEPWKAPDDVQAQAKCVIGVDYPKPIVDHEKSSKENIKLIKDVVENRFCIM